jgi:hypothetical protein
MNVTNTVRSTFVPLKPHTPLWARLLGVALLLFGILVVALMFAKVWNVHSGLSVGVTGGVMFVFAGLLMITPWAGQSSFVGLSLLFAVTGIVLVSVGATRN